MNWKRLMLMLAVSAALILPAQPQDSQPAAGQSTAQPAKTKKKKKKNTRKRRKGNRKHRAKSAKPQPKTEKAQ